MKKFVPSYQNVLVLANLVLLFFASETKSQDIIHQSNPPAIAITPPEVKDLVKYCIGVKCKGDLFYTIIPGYGHTEDEARENAQVNAEAHCGGAENVESTRHTRIEVILCPFAEIDTNPLFAVKASGGVGNWRVKGRLRYCDGTVGIQLITSGPTRCEAIKLAQTQLCMAKDPCKRAIVTVWVIETPDNVCQPTQCLPIR